MKANSSGFINGAYSNDSGERSYKLYVPVGYCGQALPLIVMLHGCKQDPDDFAAGTRMNALADEKQCLVVYPAQSISANRLSCWNWFNGENQQRDQGEPSLIAGITRQVIESHHVDTQRVYIAGLSAGGSMAIIMGTTYSDLYAAVGVHSGLAYAGAHDAYSALIAMRTGNGIVLPGRREKTKKPAHARPVSTIVFHGDMDTTVHPTNSEQVMAQSGGNGGVRPIETEFIVEKGQVPNGHAWTRILHNDKDGLGIAEHWLVHGAGHAWFGGTENSSFTDPKGPDATKEMLRFFFARTLT